MIFALCLVLASADAAFSGIVRDVSRTPLPGATIQVREQATGAEYLTLTDSHGRFLLSVPRAGGYQLTVSLEGFETLAQPALIPDDENPTHLELILEPRGSGMPAPSIEQIQLVQRAGASRLNGSAYWYSRPGALQPGFSAGRTGARLSFFVNYEEVREHADLASTRTILDPFSERGMFSYLAAGATELQQVDLLALARSNGQTSTPDHLISQLIKDIRQATAGGTLSAGSRPGLQTFSFASSRTEVGRFPATRLEFALSDEHRLSSSLAGRSSVTDPARGREVPFPSFRGATTASSFGYRWQTSLASQVSSSLGNELRVGATWTGTTTGNGTEISPGLISRSYGWKSIRDLFPVAANTDWNAAVGAQGGFEIGLDAAGISNASPAPDRRSRRTVSAFFDDTATTTLPRHTVTWGGGLNVTEFARRTETLAPSLTFDILAADPASVMFSPENFPNASPADIRNAAALYALLTGHVRSISRTATLDERTRTYSLSSPLTERLRTTSVYLFAGDSWRPAGNVTLDASVRYSIDLPPAPLNNVYSTATVADAWGARHPFFLPLKEGTRLSAVDWRNIAPAAAIAWTPTAGQRWKFTASTQVRYGRQEMSDLADFLARNPGPTMDASRNVTLGNLGDLPLLFRDSDRLAPPPFAAVRSYPLLAGNGASSVFVVDPALQAPWTSSFTASIERQISMTTSVRLMVVSSRSHREFATIDVNETDIVDNGFLAEFRKAQANLEANMAQGRGMNAGANFAYYGPGTGTAPLPIFLALFSGIANDRAANPSAYTSVLFGSPTYLPALANYNPDPVGLARMMVGDATRRAYGAAAGLPRNFFVANPDMPGGAHILTNEGSSTSRALQIEMRRRMSGGLQLQASYAYSDSWQSASYSLRRPTVTVQSTGASVRPAHVVSASGTYQLPFRARSRLWGGWQLQATMRVESGMPLDFGNVRLVSMTASDLRRLFMLRAVTDADGNVSRWMLPADIIENTIKAFSADATSTTGYGPLGPPVGRYLAPANGPDCVEVAPGGGDCGVRSLVVSGPAIVRFDVALSKRLALVRGVRLELDAQVFNLFNRPVFVPVTGATANGMSTDVADYQVGELRADTGRRAQFAMHLSW